MLAGFRSRWTTPWRCASAMARASVSTSSAAGGSRPGGAVESLVEAAAGQVLELEVGQAADRADVVDLDDARVAEPGDRLGLAPEPRRGGRGEVGPGQDHLQGASAVQRELVRQVDHPHPAAAQLAEDLVPRARSSSSAPRLRSACGSASLGCVAWLPVDSPGPGRPDADAYGSGRPVRTGRRPRRRSRGTPDSGRDTRSGSGSAPRLIR